MGRLCVSMIGGVSVLTLIFALAGCGTNAARTVNFPAPASISLQRLNGCGRNYRFYCDSPE